MLILCPRCETTFSLPDELFKPGKKARCSSCGNVFPMAAAPDARAGELSAGIGETAAPAASKAAVAQPVSFFQKFRKIIIGAAAGFFLILLCYGGWLIVSSFTSDDSPQTAGTPSSPLPASSDRHEEYERLINSISLDEVRQFFVENINFGRLMVVQGVAVNISPGNKSYITIDARILDEKNTVLAEKRQLCGVPLTLFQLQNLPEDSLKEILNNRTMIMVNNSDVPQGGKVPFVVVFPSPPASMRTFEIRVIDVRDAGPPLGQ